jgi:peroxiredoxin
MTSCGPERRVAEVWKPAPNFSLVDRQGKTWTLSELKGQVVFVNFWATWCPPCREEMPSMQRLHEMLPKDKFKMLAILNSDDPALADSFATKLGLTMPILDDQANKIGPKYGLTGMPETFIINKQGVLMEKFIGPAQWDSPAYVQMLMKYINQ